jgi:hypothetical protein
MAAMNTLLTLALGATLAGFGIAQERPERPERPRAERPAPRQQERQPSREELIEKIRELREQLRKMDEDAPGARREVGDRPAPQRGRQQPGGAQRAQAGPQRGRPETPVLPPELRERLRERIQDRLDAERGTRGQPAPRRDLQGRGFEIERSMRMRVAPPGPQRAAPRAGGAPSPRGAWQRGAMPGRARMQGRAPLRQPMLDPVAREQIRGRILQRLREHAPEAQRQAPRRGPEV